MQHIVDQILEGSGLTKSALATRSGLARSTPYRIRDGLVDPAIGTVRELALAAGLELVLSLAPLSDPDAARAARVMLEPLYEASYLLTTAASEEATKVDAWVERLRRWVPDGNPVDIVWQAGQSASLLHRPGTVFLRGHVTELKLASAGDFSGQEWFLSGAAVIDRIGEPNDDGAMRGDALRRSDGSNTSAGPYIVHTADTHRFVRLLDNLEVVRPSKANLIIAEYTAGVGVDSWEDGKIKLVAPIQSLLDAFGIGGALEAAAERIARSW